MRLDVLKSGRSATLVLVGIAALVVGGLAVTVSGGESSPAAPSTGVVRDGLLDERAMMATIEPMLTEARELLVAHVYSEQFNRFVRPCAADLQIDEVRASRGLGKADLPSLQQRLRLISPGIPLPGDHAGDLSCMLAEAGVWILAVRDTGPGRVVLTMLAGPGNLLEVEVETPVSADSEELKLTAVSLVKSPVKGTALLLRPRPADAADLTGRFTRVTEAYMSATDSMRVLAALAGRGDVDLRTVGVTNPPQREAERLARAAEPGCAETGACEVMHCGPMQRDNDVTRAALFTPADKAMICDALATWQTERHPPGGPDARTVRRALILALQADLPEADQAGPVSRVVVEHTLAGTRMLITSDLLPMLTTLPQVSQAVREVELEGCSGDPERQRCAVRAEVEVFSNARNMPAGPQKEMLEAAFGTLGLVERSLSLDFERRNARWHLVDPGAVVAALTDRSAGVVRKGPIDYFVEGIEAMR
jgi:hypothetical protein